MLPKEIEAALRELRSAAQTQRQLPPAKKNRALKKLGEALARRQKEILEANVLDLRELPPDTNSAFRDRLELNPRRIQGMVESLKKVAALPDPVGEVMERKVLRNGLRLRRVRAPLGVLFMIFESRPNIITEVFSLAFKSGNVIAMRGGSESRHTAGAIFKLMNETMEACGIHASFYAFTDYNRDLVKDLLQRKDLVDVTIPRGGDKLIEFVQQTAHMPIIKNDRGLCHTYVEADADLKMACKIVANAKCQRPGVCNALETVLVHRSVAAKFLPLLHAETAPSNLVWHADEASLAILKGAANVQAAAAKNWDTEYLDYEMNCKIVRDLDEALEHIEQHGSKHSEAIITRSSKKARRFQAQVDAAAVYWNASTRFTDGFEFGLGGELGISTQKLHVRGPVGLRELTTPRWIIDGRGQIRT